MIPVNQTKLHIPGKQNGNCMTAALASLLEMDLPDIPAFENMEDDVWFDAVVDWLNDLGFQLLQWNEKVALKGYYIANGITSRGFAHSVVYKGEKMAHDPHYLREGLKEIESVWALLPHNPAM